MRILLLHPTMPNNFLSFSTIRKLLKKPACMPPIGLLTIAALLPQQWSLKLVDCMIQEPNENDWEKCDAVFISGMNVQEQGIIKTIREGRKRKKLVVVGGPWVFHCPDVAFSEGADIIVKGEAENIISELVENINKGASGILIQGDTVADLQATLPPRYDLVDLNQYLDIGIQFTRGCPFKCDFCDIILMFGRKPRTKTADQIKNELQNMLESGWKNLVCFVDDNFIGNPSKARKLLPEIIKWQKKNKYPFRFYTQVSINVAKDKQILNLMARAGFIRVYVGIESIDSESNKSVNKNQNVDIDIAQALSEIAKVGIEVSALFIIGFDNEKSDVGHRLVEFINRNNIPDALISILQALPGTPLWQRLKEQNRLLENSGPDVKNSFDTSNICNFIPTRPLKDIAKDTMKIYEKLYRPENYIGRVYRHIKSMEAKRELPFCSANLVETKALLQVLFRWAFLKKCRLIFWKYLIAALINCPKRIDMFLIGCLKGEHFIDYNAQIQKTLRSELAKVKDPDQIWPFRM